MIIPSIDDMLAAHERINPHIHNTPVLTSSFFNELTGAELFFKCENFQKAGVFKARGASNAVFSLSKDVLEKGVPPFVGQSRAQPFLRGGSARYSLYRRYAAYCPAGQERCS